MKKTHKTSISTILKKAETFLSKNDLEIIRKAYDFSRKYYKNEKLPHGKLFIEHVLETTNILVDLRVDSIILCASLLKYCINYNNTSINEIEKEFGNNISQILLKLQKVGTIQLGKKVSNTKQIESLRKMFVTLAGDTQVILIKIVSRLNTIRNIEELNDDKKKQTAEETLKIYSPLSNLLGLWDIRSELEDLAFKNLFPKKYEKLAKKYLHQTKNRTQFFTFIIKILQKELKKHNIQANIQGRMKHLYSIYQKLEEKKKEFNEIYDVYAFRIVTNTIPNCYKILGIIHNLWPPKKNRFKDYIAAPKTNNYQSIHTTVHCSDKKLTEFQIRTKKMDEEANFGIAAHWYYKGTPSNKREKWIDNLLKIRKNYSNIREIPLDDFSNIIFVFTPTGDVVDLPKGSTCLDFAYTIHKDIGNKSASSIVNYYEKNLQYQLKDNDIVEIVIKEETKPDISWLSFVKTDSAKKGIFEWFRKHAKKSKHELGKEFTKISIDQNQKTKLENLNEKNLKKMLTFFQVSNLKTLYKKIAETEISPQEIGKFLSKKTINSMFQGINLHNYSLSHFLNKKKKNKMVSITIKISRLANPIILDRINKKIGKFKSYIISIRTKISKNQKKATDIIKLKINVHKNVNNLINAIKQISGIDNVIKLTIHKKIGEIIKIIFQSS